MRQQQYLLRPVQTCRRRAGAFDIGLRRVEIELRLVKDLPDLINGGVQPDSCVRWVSHSV